jgi:hypothetical protein
VGTEGVTLALTEGAELAGTKVSAAGVVVMVEGGMKPGGGEAP